MKEIVTLDSLYHEFKRIMKEESKFNPACEYYASNDTDRIYMMSKHFQEVARASYIGRSYNTRYKLTNGTRVFESTAAHTNLVMALVDGAISINSQMKQKLDKTYSYREIMEVVRIHDLPENRIGDWPDNGSRDETEKARLEDEYLKEYMLYYPADDPEFKKKVFKLFGEMNKQSSIAGRLIYTADKTAAIIATLTLDQLQMSPMMHINNKDASDRDKTEMSICDYCSTKGYRKASEMWTIDHFHIRGLNRFDDTGFFTAIIVMYTLLINGHWYQWREDDYRH